MRQTAFQPDRHAQALDRMSALREGTRDAHLSIESNPAMAGLLREDYTLRQYTRTLAAIFGWIAPLERQLRQDAFRHPDPAATPGRYRTPRLLADLRALGRKEAWVAQLPRVPKLPDTIDSSSRLGVLYVIEGSSLGGTVISRTLRRTLGAAVDHATAYFDCYDGEAGKAWARFRAAVQDMEQLDMDKAIEGANACFAGMDEWLRSQWPASEELGLRSTENHAGCAFQPTPP